MPFYWAMLSVSVFVRVVGVVRSCSAHIWFFGKQLREH